VCCDKLPWNDSNTVFINPTGVTYCSANQPTNNTITEHLRLLNNFTSAVTDYYLLTNSVVRIEDTLPIKQNYFIAYEGENKESLNA